ncbi:hypothetical protein WJX77_012077 [Trebouxia sp. C0004]
MSLQQAVVLGCLVENKTQDLPELFAETMSNIELAKRTVQVNSSQWNFSGCTCLPWGHNADGKLREIAESLKQIAQRVKGMQTNERQEDSWSGTELRAPCNNPTPLQPTTLLGQPTQIVPSCLRQGCCCNHMQSVSYIGHRTQHAFTQEDGQVWWAVNSNSRSMVYAHNVAKGATMELPNGGIQSAVLSLGADGSGHVWIGHQGGLVQVWCAACQCPICQWSGMCPADIRCLSTGQHLDSMWLGTAQGSVCQVQVCTPDLGMQAKPTVKRCKGCASVMKEWSLTGELTASHTPCKQGPITCVNVMRPDTILQKHDTPQACADSWRLLTGHQSGQVKLWAVPQGWPLQPLAVLGAPTVSPVQSLVVLDSLQLLCFGHLDGHVALHHAQKIVAAAPIAQSPNSQDMPVITVKNSCCQTHSSGLVQCISCAPGLITVGRAGSILLWSRDQLTKMVQQSCSHPPERGGDVKAVSAPKPEQLDAPTVEHPMQRFFGSDSVEAMRAALGRFEANKQAEPDDYSHTKSQMQPDSSTVQTHTTAHDGPRLCTLGRISETHSGLPSPNVSSASLASSASQASSDTDGHGAAPHAVLSPCIDHLNSSRYISSHISYSPFANAPGPQMSAARPSPRSVSWPNLPPTDGSDQESTQDMRWQSADEGSTSGNAAVSRRAQAQALPADAIMSSALYASHQEPQEWPPSKPSDVPTLQPSSSFGRRASLAAMLLKMRVGDEFGRKGSEASSQPSATPRSSTGQGQPMPFSVGGKGHQQGMKFTDDCAPRETRAKLSSEQIDRLAADVRLQRYHGGSMTSTTQNPGHNKHGGVSISHDAGGGDCSSIDDGASQALQPEMKRTISDVALEALESVQNLKCPIIPYRQLDIKRKIGDGSIGQVYLAKWQETDVAVKVITQMQNLSLFQGRHPQDPATIELQSQRLRDTAMRSKELVNPMADPSTALQGVIEAQMQGDMDSLQGSKSLLNLASAGQACNDDSCVSSQVSNVELTAIATLEREVSIMTAIRHPNVVMFMGLCLNPVCVVTEFCARGSLSDVIRKAATSASFAQLLDWPKRLSMALDAAKGMLQLHNHNPSILHRDLKSPNLLVDKHWRVKVTDFNLSSMLRSDADTYGVLSSAANNPRWLAPEVVASQDYSKAADVYSFGVVLWELLTWQVPWVDHNPFQIMMLLTQQQARPDIPPLDSLPGPPLPGIEEYVELMQACWHEQPDHRPGFESITGSLRLLRYQTAALGLRSDRVTDLPTQLSSSTASGSPPKPVRMSCDFSLLSSHRVPVHGKPQALAAAPAAFQTRIQAASPHPAESVRGLASAFSVISGSQRELSPAECVHKPDHVRSPFHGLKLSHCDFLIRRQQQHSITQSQTS